MPAGRATLLSIALEARDWLLSFYFCGQLHVISNADSSHILLDDFNIVNYVVLLLQEYSLHCDDFYCHLSSRARPSLSFHFRQN